MGLIPIIAYSKSLSVEIHQDSRSAARLTYSSAILFDRTTNDDLILR